MLFKKEFLNRQERKTLSDRIDSFEAKTGCELVFHIRKNLNENALAHAEKLFHKFNLHKTAHRATVMVVVSTVDRQYVVWADKEVKIKTDDNLWQQAGQILQEKLKQNLRLEAFLNLINFIEAPLEKIQPASMKGAKKTVSNEPIEENS